MMSLQRCLMFFFLILPGDFTEGVTVGNITAVLNRLLSGYDWRVRPLGGPVEIEISMRVLNIRGPSELNQDFTLTLLFRQRWRDSRLSYTPISGMPSLLVGPQLSEKICWLPDTFFPNEKSVYFHYATKPNANLRIWPSGDVLRSIRLTLTAACDMEFSDFPMDVHTCSLEIGSFGHTKEDIIYRWSLSTDAVTLAPKLGLSRFRLRHFQPRISEHSLYSGNYSRLAVDFVFERNIGYYVFHAYLPAAFVVVLSWLPFFFPRDATTGRIMIGVMGTLVLLVVGLNSSTCFPQLASRNKLDNYIAACLLFVFASLVEYCVVFFLERHPLGLRLSRTSTKDFDPMSREVSSLRVSEPESPSLKDEMKKDVPLQTSVYLAAISPDKIARVIFPSLFALYNIVYWMV